MPSTVGASDCNGKDPFFDMIWERSEKGIYIANIVNMQWEIIFSCGLTFFELRTPK